LSIGFNELARFFGMGIVRIKLDRSEVCSVNRRAGLLQNVWLSNRRDRQDGGLHIEFSHLFWNQPHRLLIGKQVHPVEVLTLQTGEDGPEIICGSIETLFGDNLSAVVLKSLFEYVTERSTKIILDVKDCHF